MNKICGTTFIVYLEWYSSIDEMRETCLQLLEYLPAAFCIHDRDVYDRDDPKLGHVKGELKKVHAHFCVNGKLSKKQVDMVEVLLKCPTHLPALQKVHDGAAMFNYLNHSDFSSEKKGKVLYDESEVYMSDLFDKSEFMSIKEEDLLKRMYDLLDDEGITEVSTFMNAVRAIDDVKFFEFCHNNILRVKPYIDSKRYSKSTFRIKDEDRKEIVLDFDPDALVVDDLKELIRKLDDQSDKAVYDSRGNRWCVCEKCGTKSIVKNFAIYGGRNKATRGICKSCLEKE